MSRSDIFTRSLIALLVSSVALSSHAADDNSASGQSRHGDTDSEDATVLHTLTISGSKIPKKAVELTHSVTVVNESQIKEEAYTDVTEILRKQAGIEFKQSGGPGQFNYMKLRGLASKNILVVLDGVKINKPSRGDTGNLLSQLDPDSIERIEILRGPQATLYGANNSAGVIVITTKSGTVSEAKIGVEAGSLGWRKGTLSARDVIATNAGRVNYSFNASDTDSDNTHEHEFFEDTTLQAKLSVDTDRISVGISGLDIDNTFGYAELDETYAELESRNEHWAFQTPDPEQFSETTQQVISLFVDHQITPAWSHKLQASRSKNTYTINDPYNGFLGVQIANVDGIVEGVSAGDPIYVYDRLYPGLEAAPLDGSETATDIEANYEDRVDQYNYDLLYQADAGNVLVGIEHLQQQAEQSGSYGESDNDDEQLSYYANGDIKLLDNTLTLALGVRYDDYESWGEQTTGNIGVSWQFTPVATLYSNVGTSFTPATLSQLYNPTYGVETLGPEDGMTYELGIRVGPETDAWHLEATYWNTQIDDAIFYDYTAENPRSSSGFGQYNNGAEARSNGIELQGDYAITPTLTLYGNYTYTDSDYRPVGDVWKRTVQIARNKGNIGLAYRQDALTLGLNAYYAGPRLRWKGDVEMKEYVRIDFSSRYSLTDALAVSF